MGTLQAGDDTIGEPSGPGLGAYEILDVLGSGGMGIVYRAVDRRTGATVALKTMKQLDPSALYRFKREFRALQDVSHPNLATLYELVSDGQVWYIAMECVDGVSFLNYVRSAYGAGDGMPGEASAEVGRRPTTDTEVLAEDDPCATTVGTGPAEIYPSTVGPGESWPTGELLDVARVAARDEPPPGLTPAQRDRLRGALRQLAEGVEALHQAGKRHRDIKPSNVLVSREGRVVLLDFGLAAELGREPIDDSTDGDIVGTVAYMAPEQAAGRPVSPASDWYSVGVVLFEALTGRPPFQGRWLEVLRDKQQLDPAPPRELAPDVPADLDTLCVELLRRDPGARPTGDAVLRRLGVMAPEPDSRMSGPAAPFVGRDRHRKALADAYSAVVGGETVVLHVHGPSGVGKSALVERFLGELTAAGEVVALTGRCHERESVPYKALDSLVDSLTRHLRRLPTTEAAALLPRDAAALARVFPVLRRVEAVVGAPRRPDEVPDPRELRRRAFGALRELLARMGDRRPLVLAIDDLQWGDPDSLALLAEVLAPPDPPVLLLLACYRSEDAETNPFLRGLLAPTGPGPDRRMLAVDPLTPGEARELAARLLGRTGEAGDQQAEAIARESGGSPFFVAELARAVQADDKPVDRPSADPAIALDDVLWARITRLPHDARRLLEAVAVSGRPVPAAEVWRGLELDSDGRAAMAVLRSGRLVRGIGPVEEDRVETYHDRVRETILAHLVSEDLRDHHRRLGRALEAAGRADPEVLGVHFRGAGERAKAGAYFVRAAAQAADALAFDHASALYRTGLELKPATPAERRRLLAALGDALANAGRGAEAARSYLEAAEGAEVAEVLELRRRAAMQFLISGHIDRGLAALRDVLAAVGMTLPPTPRRALLSLLLRRGWLRLRGLGYRRRDAGEVPAADLRKVDVCWTAGVGLSVVDTIRGADFQARGLLLALRAGEPARIARSLAMEAAHSASAGGANRRRTERLLAAAEALAGQVDQPYAIGMATLARGVSAYLEGRWRAGLEACDRAGETFRDRCTGVAWELDTVNAFALWSLSHLGEWAELCRRGPALLKEARERGDLYAAMNLSTYILSVARLAADEPDAARDEVRRSMGQWSSEGYHVQHNDQLWAATQIELYRGDGAAAWELLGRHWPRLARSLLLRVQFVRVAMRSLRARSALAASRTSAGRDSLLRSAARDAVRLESERMPWPDACARLVRAGLASAHGDRAGAVAWLRLAATAFEAVDMAVHAAAAHRRLGELVGGDEGRGLIAAADAGMHGQAIRDPARVTAMLAPGFESDQMALPRAGFP